MTRGKSRQSSSKEQRLRTGASHRERRFCTESTTTNYVLSNRSSSETSDLYIEDGIDEEIGNPSVSQESTEYEVPSSSSIDISTTEILHFRKSSVPSWSDSSGSTYVSDEFQISPQHSFQVSRKRNKDDWSTSDSNNLDTLLLSPNREKGNKSWKEKIERELDGIPIYATIEEASTNTDLSAVESLQKETARSIFCKRMVPLLIPDKGTREDISAVSIAEDPPERALNTRYKTHDRPVEPLRNVDYIPSIEVAADNEDISTVAYRIPYKIAHQAFGGSKAAVDVSMVLPRLIVHSNSHSTISSIESSDIDSEDSSYGDADSNEAIRQPRATTERSRLNIHRNDDGVGDLGKGLPSQNSDISSSDARLRDLREKIERLRRAPMPSRDRQTKNIPDIQSHRKEVLPLKPREHNSSDQHEMESISKRINELTRTAKEQRRRRGANFVDDTTGGLAHNFHYKHFNTGRSPVDFTSDDVKISENSNSLAFGTGEFPIVVHHVRQDEILTINDNPAVYQVSDIETALRVALEKKREKAAMKSREAREKLKGVITGYLSKGKKFISSTLKESTKDEHQSSLRQTWEECMEGRNKGEQALILAVSTALVVLFILLIVVLAGR